MKLFSYFTAKVQIIFQLREKLLIFFSSIFFFILKWRPFIKKCNKIYPKYNNKTFFTPIKIKNYPYVLRLITIFAAVKTNRRCETLFIIFYLYIKKKQWKQIGVSNLSLFFHFTINSTHMFIYSNSKEEILRKSSTACSTLVTFLIRR